MKARINDLLEIEGTPAEMYDYFLLLQPATNPHKEMTSEIVKKKRKQFSRTARQHISEGLKKYYQQHRNLHFRVIRHRRPMSEATKERIRQAMRKRWTTLKRQKV